LSQEIIKERRLEGEALNIDGERLIAIVDCQLEGCNIAINSLNGADGLLDCKIQNCTIEVSKKRNRSVFLGSDFQGCNFKGNIRNADFGRSRTDHPVFEKFNRLGSIVDCDFTQATLDMCRFFEVDLSRQKFASWPQFVVPHESRLAAAKLQREWPGKIGLYLMVAAQDERSTLSGVTGTLAYFMKNYAVTEEELQQVLDDIGGVFR
jgi:uncharacterized protein YjbI with pentapeptide repeats